MPEAAPVRLPHAAWFVAAFVGYVVLGLLTRTVVLNWIIGPLWLLITLYLLPTAVRRVTRRVDR